MVNITKISDYKWLIPPHDNMRTEAVIYADHNILGEMQKDGSLRQLENVAGLPGIVGPALAMPDAHQGYGFPIGGVAAFDEHEGIISPGGVGYDINCGVRLLRSFLQADDLSDAQLGNMTSALAATIPAGVGQGGSLRLNQSDFSRVAESGAGWAVKQGYGQQSDLDNCESQGCLPGADPEAVSQRARQRGAGQLGTLGAGNHFVEIARVDQVFDQKAATVYGLEPGQVVIWLHSGSRGLGHQVCDDYLKQLSRDSKAVHAPDRQLVAAPPKSGIGRAYLGAMAAAANYAFANRQMLTHLAREALCRALQSSPADLGLSLVYDVAHNIVKREKHQVPGAKGVSNVWVHRKGATRALGPNHPETPSQYRGIGQPVLLPGDMGRYSFVLKGTELAEAETFASAAHGAGRRMSRKAAKKGFSHQALSEEMAGVRVMGHKSTLAEERPLAYKDAWQVAQVMDNSGIAGLVVKTVPLAVIKG